MGIQTFLERKSRYYKALMMENIDSEVGIKVQLGLFGSLPRRARLLATFDNGRENYNHIKLKIHLGMKHFFVILTVLGKKDLMKITTEFFDATFPRKQI